MVLAATLRCVGCTAVFVEGAWQADSPGTVAEGAGQLLKGRAFGHSFHEAKQHIRRVGPSVGTSSDFVILPEEGEEFCPG